MSCVRGIVAPAPEVNSQTAVDQAREFDAVPMRFGAVRVVKCWGGDVPPGQLNDCDLATQAAVDETVMFRWLEQPDKATSGAGIAQMEAWMTTDPRFEDNLMAFDARRLIIGGFSPVM